VGIFTIAILIFIVGVFAAVFVVRLVLTRAMQARMGGKEAYKEAWRTYNEQMSGQPGHGHGHHGGGIFGGHGGGHHGGGFFGGGHHGGGGGGGDGGGGGGHHH
jgi:Glycine rich protein family